MPYVQSPLYRNLKDSSLVKKLRKQHRDETDIMVAPSIWYETFGFTVLEALSYGVPVHKLYFRNSS